MSRQFRQSNKSGYSSSLGTSDKSSSSTEVSYTLADLAKHYGNDSNEEDDAKDRTLNDSSQHRGQVAYILLFKGNAYSNPRFDSDGILFVKGSSNLQLLPGYATFHHSSSSSSSSSSSLSSLAKDDTTTASAPAAIKKTKDVRNDADALPQHIIHIFTQVPTTAETETPLFAFKGFYRLKNLQFLEPKSQEVEKLLKQKFLSEARTPEEWEANLQQEWAVVMVKEVVGEWLDEVVIAKAS